MSIINGANAVVGSAAGGYEIERSLRFNSADSAYLNRTPGSNGSRTTWTWSGWIKRGALGSGTLFSAGLISSTFYYTSLGFGDQLSFANYNDTNAGWLTTTQVFRDSSAWYHIVAVFDSTNATSTDRIRLYANGERITAFSTGTFPTTYPAQNVTSQMNTTAYTNWIGSYVRNGGSGSTFNGYMSEVHFIDGQALTPSDFGEFNSETGVWQPIAYTGSYGTNGFYLDFADNSSTTALGYDAAGSNDWTPNNFSVTAGAGNDSLVDSPTRYGTDTGAGGEVRGNYATLNPLDKTAAATLSNGNLQALLNGANYNAKSTIAVSSGKWYWEVTASATNEDMIGIAGSAVGVSGYFGSHATSYGYYKTNGYKYNNTTGTAYGATYASGDIIGVALDLDAGTLTYYKNGVSQGTAFTGLSGTFFAGVSTAGTGGTQTINFGQRPFAYTAPSGFKALCTTNLPEPTVADGGEHFNALTYTGNGVNAPNALSVTGAGFQPDWVWIKSRSNAYDNILQDAVRGTGFFLVSNSTAQEQITGGGDVSSFDSDGFTVSYANARTNQSGATYVAWNWKANGAGVSNTAGTISSTVSANTTSGFSIVTYTGTGANATVGHGLGVAPSMIITKSRTSSVADWGVYHTSIGNTKYLLLNTTAASATSVNFWNNTSPTSTVFSVGISGSTNNTTTMVAYCFSAIAGYSAFGSYTGNGSTDGPFVFTGFRPRYLLIKSSSAAVSGWVIYDTVRSTYNVTTARLFANSSGAQDTGLQIDILSNGFKLREAGGQGNDNGVTYIYAAFAENPFKYSLAR